MASELLDRVRLVEPKRRSLAQAVKSIRFLQEQDGVTERDPKQ